MINTHADSDHISGNGAFEELYMSPAEEDNYRHNGGKLIEGAEQIRRGEATGTEINLFGNDVILYKFPYAGFLCEAK